jgi:hypothetical protein
MIVFQNIKDMSVLAGFSNIGSRHFARLLLLVVMVVSMFSCLFN